MVRPRISTSREAVRIMCVIGEVQRRISSIADGISKASRESRSRSDGLCISAFMPPLIALRVVSWPPSISRKQLKSTSMSVRRSPVDFAVDERADEVRSGIAAALADQLHEVVEDLHLRL